VKREIFPRNFLFLIRKVTSLLSLLIQLRMCAYGYKDHCVFILLKYGSIISCYINASATRKSLLHGMIVESVVKLVLYKKL
jgi:hypothetical protein